MMLPHLAVYGDSECSVVGFLCVDENLSDRGSLERLVSRLPECIHPTIIACNNASYNPSGNAKFRSRKIKVTF